MVAALLGAPGAPCITPKAVEEASGEWMLPRVGLVTYGCQLRAYFGRFFPELYGPAVLGVSPAASASLFRADPWAGQWARDAGSVAIPEVLPGSLRWALGGHRVHGSGQGGDKALALVPGRWVNLWRLTDYLGMPVVAMPPQDVMAVPASPMAPLLDWYAEEVDYTAYLLAVLTHSDYPRTAEYAAALTLLVGQLGGLPRTQAPGEPPADQ